MKRGYVVIIVIVAVVLVLFFWIKGMYNSMVRMDEGVSSAWAVDPSSLSEAEIAQFTAAQDELGAAIGRLLVSVERYPDLKANQNFLELQAQLEGTENRITVERQKFNEAARSYNVTIRRFPNNIFAGMFGFEKKGYFEASEGAEQAPVVSF